MKKMKKFASLLLAGIMTVAMAAPAFATAGDVTETTTAKGEGSFTITLENDKSGHTYEAYQIFTGDLLETTTVSGEGEDQTTTTTKVLSNIEWGSGVNTEGLVAALKENTTLESVFEGLAVDASAAEVAECLEGQANDGDIARAFADVIAGHLETAAGISSEVKDSDGNTTGYTISNLKAGYYLVKETTASVTGEDAYSRYILQVVSDVTAQVKTEIPTIDKKIVEGEEKVESNTASVGSVVSYEITGAVPDYTGYEKYYYVINDTLSDGLTFNNDVVVKVGEETLTRIDDDNPDGDYYLYTGTASNPYTFQVAFADIKAYNKGTDIVVSYSATVNADAVTGTTGNPNKVTLTYSNNPNSDENGENGDKPGTPDPQVPVGETPEEITITYLTEIEITKVDENNQPLAGAEFTLTGTSKQTVLKDTEYYEEDAENGTYYLLKDGTYTETAPTKEETDEDGNVTEAGNEEYYVSTVVKYTKKTAATTEEVEFKVKMVATSDEAGKLVFTGLGAGTYEIEETVVPAGYNKAENQKVVISCKLPSSVKDGTETVTWEKGDGCAEDVSVAADSSKFLLTIKNQAGSTLPETGGMGTTIFYVVGAVLILGAGVLLITRRRMREE